MGIRVRGVCSIPLAVYECTLVEWFLFYKGCIERCLGDWEVAGVNIEVTRTGRDIKGDCTQDNVGTRSWKTSASWYAGIRILRYRSVILSRA